MSGKGKDGEHRFSVYSSAHAKSCEKQGDNASGPGVSTVVPFLHATMLVRLRSRPHFARLASCAFPARQGAEVYN